MKKSQTFKNTVASLIVFLIALTPLWIFIASRSLFQPTGFWQNLILAGVGLYFLGGVQLALIIIALLITFLIIWD